MQFKILAISALASLAAADFAGVLKSLALVDSDTAALNKTVIAYDGNFFKSIPILAASGKLKDDLKNGTGIANASAPFTVGEAIQLIDPVNAIARDSNITLESIIAKYPLFKKNYIDGIVKTNLVDTRKASQDYSNAIIAKVPDFLQDSARQIAAPIDQGFAKAIAVYSQGGF